MRHSLAARSLGREASSIDLDGETSSDARIRRNHYDDLSAFSYGGSSERRVL